MGKCGEKEGVEMRKSEEREKKGIVKARGIVKERIRLLLANAMITVYFSEAHVRVPCASTLVYCLSSHFCLYPQEGHSRLFTRYIYDDSYLFSSLPLLF